MVFFWAMLILIGMVVADFFVPMLPSATLVTAAAGLVFGNPLLIGVLVVGAAAASWLGEFLGYRLFRSLRTGLARRGPHVVRGLVTGTVARLETLLQRTISDHPYRTTMVARFLPAGRTALAWAAAGTSQPPYARMAALGGALWAVYSVTLGLLIAWIAGPGLHSLIGSVVTMAAVGLFLGWIARRWQQTRPDLPDTADLAIAAAPATILPGPDAAHPRPAVVLPAPAAADGDEPPATGETTARAA
jgi:membrane protein DedA with SNARE-associated domain